MIVEDEPEKYYAIQTYKEAFVTELENGSELDDFLKSTFKNSELCAHAINSGEFLVIKGKVVNLKFRQPPPRLVVP